MAIRVLHVGLGPIGVGVVRQCAERKGFKIVGAVDLDPAKVGKDLGEVAEVGRVLKVTVHDKLGAAVKAGKPDVVVLCTSSSLEEVLPQLADILKHKLPIVSTTEELAYPWYSNKRLAKKVDALAKKARVAVLGTGVNPGFCMDALPITLTGVCERVDRIRVERIQDASVRRLPFQQKIGAGLTPEQFQEQVDNGSVRHVGLTESVAMIADAMGWKLDRITDEIGPKIAARATRSPFLSVARGQVAGIVQTGVGYRHDEPLITLHMEAYLGAPESYDAVTVTGSPDLQMKIDGGVHGDVATASITVNSIPKILEARPGLQTMRSMVIPSYYGGKKA
ncbi:MAG: NAD(P)H-dependent amine dehydrogenase family protein [Luteitalea sp.]